MTAWDDRRLSHLGDTAARELSRLAVADGGGYKILELLDHLGWSTGIVSALGYADADGTHTGGVLVLARQRAYPNMEIARAGPSVAQVAPALLEDALVYGTRAAREH